MNPKWQSKQTEMMGAMLEMLSPALHEIINKGPLCKEGNPPNEFILMVVSPDPDRDGTAVFSYASSAPPAQALPAMKEFCVSFEKRLKDARH